jgi:hypothetical protein
MRFRSERFYSRATDKKIKCAASRLGNNASRAGVSLDITTLR